MPILIGSLGIEKYGGWIIISSLPSWLSMVNFGIGTSGANAMALAGGEGDIKKAESIYSNTMVGIAGVVVLGFMLVAAAGFIIPVNSILNITDSSESETYGAILVLALSTLLSFFKDAIGGKYLVARKAPVLYFINSLLPWLQLIAIGIISLVSKSYFFISLGMLISMILFLTVNFIYSKKICPDISIKFPEVTWTQIREQVSKGAAFQAIPLGNALMYQGSLMVVNFSIGSAAVAIFSTCRTLTRSVNQILEVVNQTIWPEIAHKIGQKDWPGVQDIHRRAVLISLIAGIAGLLGLYIAGPTIYSIWTRGHIKIESSLLFFFLLSIPGAALWSTSAVVQLASNQHVDLAKRYVIGCILSVVFCVLVTPVFGIRGAAIATTGLDIVMIPFVLHRSLDLIGDSVSQFSRKMLSDIIKFPTTVSWLLRKVARRN